MSKREEEEKEFKFLEAPEEGEIPSFRKSASFVSYSEKAVDEFLSSGLDSAKVKVPEGKSKIATARALAKILKRKGHPEFTARVDREKKVWILRR